MKKWVILVAILSILFIGGYLVLSFHAVKFIDARLQKAVRPGFVIREVKMRPTYLSLKGVHYEDPRSKRAIFQAEEMRIYPDILSSMRGSLRIREWALLRPSFFFSRSPEGGVTGPWVSTEKGRKGEIPGKEGKKGEESPVPIKIDLFRVEKGLIDFQDMKPAGTANFRLIDLDLKVEDIRFPFISSHSALEFKGKTKGGMKDGSLSLKGWIDIQTMDMEISLQAQEIDVKAFEPYYRKRVSAEIESGYMNMESKIAMKERVIDAPGQMELTDLYIKEGGTVFWVPAKTLISLLKDKKNRVKVKFHVKGNMDDPQFDLQETFLNRVAFSFAENLGMPVKVVGKILLEGTGKGAEGLAEELKSIGELFKKKEKRR